jgi:uncharacterized RDD family membrane protein YckC
VKRSCLRGVGVREEGGEGGEGKEERQEEEGIRFVRETKGQCRYIIFFISSVSFSLFFFSILSLEGEYPTTVLPILSILLLTRYYFISFCFRFIR